MKTVHYDMMKTKSEAQELFQKRTLHQLQLILFS